MIAGLAVDLLLAAGSLTLAFGVVSARRVFTAIALFIAHGLLLALAWVRLDAVDVALTEAAIGAGLSGVLLLAARHRLARAGTGQAAEAPGRAATIAIGLGCAAVTAALGYAVLVLPEPAPSLAAEVAANLAATELGNPVTGVLMVFRGLDTLLEAAVLVLAVIGVWSLAPDTAWRGAPGAPWTVVEDGPLALLARLLPPIGIVVALHILWVGADAPGGKFQAGAILAAMGLLAWLAGLVRVPPTASRAMRAAIAVGPALFIVVGLAGLVFQGAFLAYPEGLVKPVILLIEFVLTASVAAALALLVMGPPSRDAPR
jgi:multisubunit Na+/H+ antiporter MnhB subunit